MTTRLLLDVSSCFCPTPEPLLVVMSPDCTGRQLREASDVEEEDCPTVHRQNALNLLPSQAALVPEGGENSYG